MPTQIKNYQGKKALITGITGQDGSYLAEYLLSLGYEVHGIVRRVAFEDPDNRLGRIKHLRDKLILHAGSLESFPSLYKVLQTVMPDECYHLAAQSFVSYSFEDEFTTMNTNINGTHHILSALKSIKPDCHFYFAGSSEMFGKVEEVPQTEKTRFHPRSVYGISKVAGYDLTRNYREAYNMFCVSGILFNHESPRRGKEFVTRKITNTVAQIKYGIKNELRLGNLDARRDWGFAGDFVKVMHAMLNYHTPTDFVIGTGKTHSVKEFIQVAFNYVGLNWEKYVVVDPLFYRPAEVELLISDPQLANQKLKWKSEVSFKELVEMMVEADLMDIERHRNYKEKKSA